eukprot:s2238_g21.t1
MRPLTRSCAHLTRLASLEEISFLSAISLFFSDTGLVPACADSAHVQGCATEAKRGWDLNECQLREPDLSSLLLKRLCICPQRQLESFAVLVAFHLWGSELKRRHVVVFLDNEGCRYLILKGYANNANLQDIVHGIARLELQWCMLPWYARVPTECNLADYPSREKAHEMLPETLRVKVPAFENVWPNR